VPVEEEEEEEEELSRVLRMAVIVIHLATGNSIGRFDTAVF
jgi:hypothetical protein